MFTRVRSKIVETFKVDNEVTLKIKRKVFVKFAQEALLEKPHSQSDISIKNIKLKYLPHHNALVDIDKTQALVLTSGANVHTSDGNNIESLPFIPSSSIMVYNAQQVLESIKSKNLQFFSFSLLRPDFDLEPVKMNSIVIARSLIYSKDIKIAFSQNYQLFVLKQAIGFIEKGLIKVLSQGSKYGSTVRVFTLDNPSIDDPKVIQDSRKLALIAINGSTLKKDIEIIEDLYANIANSLGNGDEIINISLKEI